MASGDENKFSDELLRHYLLGTLAGEAAGRVDERSIADEEFALRVDGAEHELVDAYVRGELSGEEFDRFQSFYLRSAQRREKVEFSRALFRLQGGTSTEPGAETERRASKAGRWNWLTVPRLGLQWSFAAAALVMLIATAYLVRENTGLERQEIAARNEWESLGRHAQELERQLNEQHAANASLQKELEGLRASFRGSQLLKTIAVLLLPQTRGAGQIPSVSVPQGTDRIRIDLQLEPNDFRTYQVALKDPATNRILWEASKLHFVSQGQNKVVSANLPTRLLKQQNYILELTGIPANGSPELASSYAFRVVPK